VFGFGFRAGRKESLSWQCTALRFVHPQRDGIFNPDLERIDHAFTPLPQHQHHHTLHRRLHRSRYRSVIEYLALTALVGIVLYVACRIVDSFIKSLVERIYG
jgi:hypothetical protein